MSLAMLFAYMSTFLACGLPEALGELYPSCADDVGGQQSGLAAKPSYIYLREELGRWAEVLDEAPDRDVVTDLEAVRRIEATGLPWRIVDKRSGAIFLLVPPGEFLRGAPREDDYTVHEFEFPWRRQVRVAKPFYLGQTELTCEQWASVMGVTPGYIEEAELDPEKTPLVDVSVEEFLPFLALTGLSLPRASDWEYACRASNGQKQVEALHDFARVQGNVDVWDKRLTPIVSVATRKANAWGFFDMLGGAYELTSTVFDLAWEGPPKGELYDSVRDDELGESPYTERFGTRFTVRGGSLGAPEECATPWHVGTQTPTKGHITIGYRVAWYPEECRPSFALLSKRVGEAVNRAK